MTRDLAVAPKYLKRGIQLLDGSNIAAVATPNLGGTATSRSQTQRDDGYEIRYESATATQYVETRIDFATPQDWSGYDQFAVDLIFPEGEGGDTYQNDVYVQFFIKGDAGGTYTNYFGVNGFWTQNKKPRRRTAYFAAIPIGSGGDFNVFGSPSLASVRGFTLRLYRVTSNGGPNCVRLAGLWKGLRSGVNVIQTFDHIFDDIYNEALPVFSAYGWQGTMFTVPSEIDLGSHMTQAQLQALYVAGWDVSPHSHIFPVTTLTITSSGTTATATCLEAHGLTTGDTCPAISGAGETLYNGAFQVTVTGAKTFTYTMDGTPSVAVAYGLITMPLPSRDAARAAILANRAALAAMGFSRGNDLYAFGQGLGDTDDITWLRSQGFRMARGTGGGIVYPTHNLGAFSVHQGRANIDGDISGIAWDFPVVDLATTNTSYNTAAKVLAIVDNAIARGGMNVCLMTHQIVAGGSGATTYDRAEWLALMAGIRDRELKGLLRVSSASQWLAGFVGRRAST